MKNWIAVIMMLVLALTASACSTNHQTTPVGDEPTAEEPTAEEPTAEEPTAALMDDEALAAHVQEVIETQGYKGIVYLTHNGEVIFQSAAGTDELGDDLTIDSSMYVGSVSKQFCAAAIMILRDEGKLSVEDTLDKYFPEYETGKDITIKNLLSMRSGIMDMVNQGSVEEISRDQTEAENVDAIKSWIFSQPLQSEPDTVYAYTNSNYFLLGCIVEQASGQHYIDFVRERIFEPLGMTRTGFFDELPGHPAWLNGLSTDIFESEEAAKGLTKGAGDIVTTAPDMDKWMTGLSNGTLISSDSFREMTADYSPDSGASYGYGLMQMFGGGVGHGGNIGTYSAIDYINTEHGYNLFCVSGKNSMSSVTAGLPSLLLGDAVSE